MKPSENVDHKVVRDFGKEWSTYDQSGVSQEELSTILNEYFAVFPWEQLPKNAKGFDLGCGSGRWAKMVAPRVGELHCIDPSEEALDVARRNLEALPNCVFHAKTVDDIPLDDQSMDFGYSLGVLDHVPDTAAGIRKCVEKLKPGAPMLVYIYYALEFRPWWFRAIWKITNVVRRIVAGLPHPIKLPITRAIAATIYFPLARAALLLERLGFNVNNIPLSAYRNKSFYTMATDALDRFGSRIEHRYTKDQLHKMMSDAGLVNIRFHNGTPYWCAVGFRASQGPSA
ncbi:MAG: class I SAM-dependent methyltransferase [Nitrospirota bacterium]|nr:class I SAM-dependent methyltransferase [Nitrospirota bacterium]